MKRITTIEFVNYKAFYDRGEENKIAIPEGRSVLFYGENGSGKSSIYEGLKQFFNSSDNTLAVIPARHIAVPKTRTEIDNAGTPEATEREVSNEVAVKITFTDNKGSETKTFGVPIADVQGTNYIAQANLLNGFLSYRELLRTYLMDKLNDRTEFRRKFANLLIENILAKNINSATQRTYINSWEALFVPRAWNKEHNLKLFANGLKLDIHRINLILNNILNYFEPDLQVQLVLESTVIDYIYSYRHNRMGKYPICEIDLEVNLFGLNTENDEENHLTVLNEARLSALAISIYLASLINTPQDNFDFKLLFLDDIFIGLDMSNRLPLLEILKSFKKPIIEQFVDGDNHVVERIQTVNGVVQTDAEPFFRNFQIFISTYDRFWFSVAKNWFETKSPNKWCFFEMFANKKEGQAFNTPLIYTSLNYLQQANYYYSKHDYPTCANHLRKALEQQLKVLLPQNRQYVEYLNTETGETETRKLKTLNQYLEKFISYCTENGINASELADLKNLKDWYFNPFSHDDFGTPIFKRELDIAKELVERLENFEFHILLPAGTRLYFSFDNGAGETRNYKVELQENLRRIISGGVNLLTNPAIQCYEWTENANASQNVRWVMNGQNPLRLISFYNNKRNSLAKANLPNVPTTTLWNEIFLVANDRPLITKIQ